MHLVNWETITFLVYEGRLEIMNLGDMNKALVVKWIFNYTNSKEAFVEKGDLHLEHG